MEPAKQRDPGAGTRVAFARDMRIRFPAVAALAILLGCGSEDEPTLGGPAPADSSQTSDSNGTLAAPTPGPSDTSNTPSDSNKPPTTNKPDPNDPNVIKIPDVDKNKWVWIPIEGNVCGDGTPAGIGVNFTDESRQLVVWFQGNGICYDTISCNLFPQMLVGMGADPITHLFWDDPNSALHGPFNRKDELNPFRKDNFVVFPHCALDGHAGDKDTDYIGIGTVHQHGYTNVTRALKRIVPTFSDATRVIVAGFSAGGIGTVANYHQIATAFEAIGKPPPFMINDAGPVIQQPWLAMSGQKALRKGWGLDATFISFCPECIDGGIHLVHEAMWKTHKGMRSSLISTYSDGVAGMLYRLIDKAPLVIHTYHDGLQSFEKWAESKQAEIAPSKHRSFFRPGGAHGQIYPDFSANPELAAFVQAQLDDSPTWQSDVP
jgi:hypothetical protein